MPAERDMRRHSFPLTGLRFRPVQCQQLLPGHASKPALWGHPYSLVHPFGYFSRWGMGKAYPLGTGWGSRLLLASGKLEDLHILTTSLSLSARLSHTIYKHTSLKFLSLNSEVLSSPGEKV